MLLEELIYKNFISSEELTKRLAVFSNNPAVFSPSAPEDNQPDWKGKSQYPRIVYNFDLQANEERHSIGTLLVSLYCQNTKNGNEPIPEEIEPVIRACLKDVLLKSEGNLLYAFAWNRTDSFEIEEKRNGLVIGLDVRFDILEYPSQETTDPDPIEATNRYIKKLYPDCLVVGLDIFEEITKASEKRPVIYCRLNSADIAEQTNTVLWLDGKIAIHILCPNSEVRLKIAMDIAQRISLAGEITLIDTSPMFVNNLQIDNKSDYLKEGQIFITGRYGILRYKAKPNELNKIHNNYG